MRYLVLLLILILIASCSAPTPPSPTSTIIYDDVPEDMGDDSLPLIPEDRVTFDVQGDIWSGVINNPKAHQEGTWSQVFDWPLIAYNAALLPDGKVFTFGSNPVDQYIKNGRAFYNDVWSPDMGLGLESHTTLQNTSATNLFCAAQMLLNDGELLIAGGDKTEIDQVETGDDGVLNNAGVQDLNLFDYRSSKITLSPLQMTQGRWYPTMTTLANGDVLVQGGIDITRQPSITPEVWSSEGGWKVLSDATSATAYNESWSYPFSFLAPNGKVFVAGKGRNMWYIDPDDNGSIQYVGVRENLVRSQGSAVMYGEGKILIVGGGANPSNSALKIDISGENPIVESTEHMSVSRKFLDATLLADGQVFVNGGSYLLGDGTMQSAVYTSEIWNPDTGQWSLSATAQRPRMYHSTALLLPNGTVLTAGGDRPTAARNFNAEIYYPPYLFKKDGSGDFAPRPSIVAMSDVDYGQSFMATFGNANEVSRVTLVRFGSVTHGFNMDQRFLELRV